LANLGHVTGHPPPPRLEEQPLAIAVGIVHSMSSNANLAWIVLLATPGRVSIGLSYGDLQRFSGHVQLPVSVAHPLRPKARRLQTVATPPLPGGQDADGIEHV
jgi:hypothetical protein